MCVQAALPRDAIPSIDEPVFGAGYFGDGSDEVVAVDADPRGRSPAAVDETAPYERYDAAAGFGLRAMRGEGRERSWDRGDIDAKTTVLGIVRGDDAVGCPAPVVADSGGVVEDTVGGLSDGTRAE